MSFNSPEVIPFEANRNASYLQQMRSHGAYQGIARNISEGIWTKGVSQNLAEILLRVKRQNVDDEQTGGNGKGKENGQGVAGQGFIQDWVNQTSIWVRDAPQNPPMHIGQTGGAQQMVGGLGSNAAGKGGNTGAENTGRRTGANGTSNSQAKNGGGKGSIEGSYIGFATGSPLGNITTARGSRRQTVELKRNFQSTSLSPSKDVSETNLDLKSNNQVPKPTIVGCMPTIPPVLPLAQSASQPLAQSTNHPSDQPATQSTSQLCTQFLGNIGGHRGNRHKRQQIDTATTLNPLAIMQGMATNPLGSVTNLISMIVSFVTQMYYMINSFFMPKILYE